MGDNASVLAPDRVRSSRSSSQLGQAERMLVEARAELQRLVNLIAERGRDRKQLDTDFQAITSTGDVDRIMQTRSRRAQFDEDTRGFERRRAELEQSVENKARYVETLRLSVENIRNEITYLQERLEPNGYHAKRIQALEIDLELARSGKASEESRLANLKRQIWTIVGEI